jgi:hypothetical protein
MNVFSTQPFYFLELSLRVLGGEPYVKFGFRSVYRERSGYILVLFLLAMGLLLPQFR